MNLKNDTIYLLIGLCFLSINLFLFIHSNNEKEKEYLKTLSILQEKNKWIEYTLINHIKYSPIKNIATHFYRPHTLVYRYCDETCEKCVSEDLQALYTLQKKIGKNHILIIPSFIDSPNNKIRIAQELHNFTFKNIPDKQDMPISEDTGLHSRYFIYWGNNKNDCYIYFPTKSQERLTQLFFNLIIEKLNTVGH